MVPSRCIQKCCGVGEGGGKDDLLYRVETIVDPSFYEFGFCKALCIPMVARRPKLLDDRRDVIYC